MLRRILAALGLALAFVATQASAQSITTYTFTTLPGSPSAGQLAWITDGSGTATVGAAAAGSGANKDLVSWDPVDARWEFVQRLAVPGPVGVLTPYLEALRVGYNNATSALLAGNVQDAIDELALYAKRGGKIGIDRDGDGFYDEAWYHDADHDGSGFVTCTANAAPDIACKAIGEKLDRDFIDDTNYMIHYLMGPGSVVRYSIGVYVGYPCWNPTSGVNPPLTAETSDDAHDGIGGDTAFLGQCVTDADGAKLFVVSAEGKDVTLQGAGGDTRRLERGSMSASLRRDRGTYFVTDMGPWDNDGSHNKWNGFFANLRFLSGGYHGLVGANAVQHTGAGIGGGDAKGWGEFISFDPNYDLWSTDTTTVCIRNSGGTPGVTHSADGWMTALNPGALLVIPVRTSASTSIWTQHEVVIREDPTVACGTGGIAVTFGGNLDSNGTATKAYPPYAGNSVGLVGSGQVAIAPRSDYKRTNFRVRNVTIAPQDPWNEFGGRCTNDTTNDVTDNGSAMKTTVGGLGKRFKLVTSEGGSAPFDDTNYDLSCDTSNLVGFFGGGKVTLEDSVLTNGHMFWIDGGSTGGLMTAQRNRFMFGNGREIVDGANNWRFLDNIVDDSYFSGNILTWLGADFILDGLIVRNTSFTSAVTLNDLNEGSVVRNVRVESSPHGMIANLVCGARFNLIEALYTTGDGVWPYTSNNGSVVFDCDQTATPITMNTVRNVVEDIPGKSISGEQLPPILFNANAATNGSMSSYAAIYGNSISEVRQIGNSSGDTGGEQGCLFGVLEADSDNPQDDQPPAATANTDDGESVVFSTNYFSNSSVAANGRAFCITNGTYNAHIDREKLGSGAQPQACGVMDGGVAISYGLCR